MGGGVFPDGVLAGSLICTGGGGGVFSVWNHFLSPVSSDPCSKGYFCQSEVSRGSLSKADID